MITHWTLLVETYMDDICMASPSPDRIQEFASDLANHLRVKLIGDIQFILGWKISSHKDKVIISEKADRFTGCQNAIPEEASTSARPTRTVKKRLFRYREIVGSLLLRGQQYTSRYSLSCSSLSTFHFCHLSWGTSRLSSGYWDFWRSPSLMASTSSHWANLSLQVFADSDFALDSWFEARSKSGKIFITNGPIFWSARWQTSTALSTTEAEINGFSGGNQTSRKPSEEYSADQSTKIDRYLQRQCRVSRAGKRSSHPKSNQRHGRPHRFRTGPQKV